MEAADKKTYVDFAYPSADNALGKSFQTCPPQALLPLQMAAGKEKTGPD